MAFGIEFCVATLITESAGVGIPSFPYTASNVCCIHERQPITEENQIVERQ